MVQNSIYVACSFLIEHKSYMPTPPPPAPFTSVVGVFERDPAYSCPANNDFSGCDESWSVIIRESENIFIASAGLYSWFSTYAQTCIDTEACQKALMLLDSNFANVRIQNLITIGAKYMAVMDGEGIAAADNLDVSKHPNWSQISILDVGGNGTLFNEIIWIDPTIWEMDQPKFTCSPPCNVKLPPWTSATSTVNYPLITVSDGTWTSTITKAPLTISQWVFEVVTLTQGSNSNKKAKRQNFDAFWPVPALTPSWPAVAYTGLDGNPTTTAPGMPFPTPPPSIGPGVPPPPTGSWPNRAVQPFPGLIDQPTIAECEFWDFLCINNPWMYSSFGNDTSTDDDDDDDDDFDENWQDAMITCPAKTSSSVTVSPPTPQPSPFEEGDPTQNQIGCYNSGETTERDRMDNAAISFCNNIGHSGDTLAQNYFNREIFPFPYNGGFGTVEIVISLEIKPECDWPYDYNQCLRYLSVPTDGCNCGGVNGKQGGTVENNCYKWRIDPNLSF